ncbi:MAG: hypothetical protein AB1641_16805 [Thermodesulfobacteriota bacterium]
MNEDLATVIAALKERLSRTQDWLELAYPYLDPEGARHLFQELTGLKHPPKAVFLPAVNDSSPAEIRLEAEHGQEQPDHILFEAMLPILERKIPYIRKADDLNRLERRLAWIKGLLAATRFPDGELNLEIVFAGVRGLLFYDRRYFSSMIRPLLTSDRVHALALEVEALVYSPGRVERLIFYHQSYGDNKEHQWLPLVPLAIRDLGRPREEEWPT